MTVLPDPAAVGISSVADIRRAAEALYSFAQAVGPFRPIVTHNIASKQPMVDQDGEVLAQAVFGYDGPGDDWWRSPERALYSPVARACRYENEPFWVTPAGFLTRCPNPYLDEIDLTRFEALAVARSMIVVPIHLPFGQIGLAAYAPHVGRSVNLGEVFEAHGDTLMVMSHRFVSGYVKATRTRRWVPGNCRLTRREIECLRWAAIGKTDAEIGLILNVRHSTIRFHLQNAGEKLNAVNRGQTIFKAAQLGFLGLS